MLIKIMSWTVLDGLLNLDLFGEKPELRIGNSSKNNTYLGLTFSIVIYFLMIGLAVYFGDLIFSRSVPTVIFSQKNYETPKSIKFTRNNFTIAIALQSSDTYEEFIDETIYTLNLFNYRTKSGDNGTRIDESKNIPLVHCSNSYFPPNVREQFRSVKLQNMYCADDVDLDLIGTWLTPELSNLEFQFYQCVNSTRNNNSCQSPKAINEKLSSIYVSVYFVDLTIDPNNLTNPAQYFQGDYFDLISNQFYKEYQQFFKSEIVYTDLGYVFNTIDTSVYVSSDHSKALYNPYPTKNGNFYKYILRLANLETHYLRSYMKIQTAAALLGGILSAFQSTTYILLLTYNKLKFFELFANKIYSFEKGTSKKKKNLDQTMKKVRIVEEEPKINNLVDNSAQNLNNIDLKKNNTVAALQEKKRISESFFKSIDSLKNMRISLIDTFNYMVFNICKNRSKKMSFINLGIQQINSKLDLMYIIGKLNETDKLKKLLLDDDQLILFNYSQKIPVYDYSVAPEDNEIGEKIVSDKEEIIKAYGNIFEKIENNYQSQIDQKLCKIFRRFEMKN